MPLRDGAPLDVVREICLALPEVTERLSHGAPTFFVKKSFLMVWPDGHHDNQFPHLWAAAAPGVQAEVIEDEPARFFRPPYVGGRGWIGVRLADAFDAAGTRELRAICTDAYRAVAPPKLVARL
ncbi:MAG: MmcQ/YjbR family DNA-binding protein [Actinomycetota bacterium]|nr:MmcQ/YjbR family DNA-binding protein [Actinomycetota bacterium]